MAHQQDGLVPIGEAFGGLGAPEKVLRDTSPQARHHFTRADQVREPKRKSRLRLQRC